MNWFPLRIWQSERLIRLPSDLRSYRRSTVRASRYSPYDQQWTRWLHLTYLRELVTPKRYKVKQWRMKLFRGWRMNENRNGWLVSVLEQFQIFNVVQNVVVSRINRSRKCKKLRIPGGAEFCWSTATSFLTSSTRLRIERQSRRGNGRTNTEQTKQPKIFVTTDHTTAQQPATHQTSSVSTLPATYKSSLDNLSFD